MSEVVRALALSFGQLGDRRIVGVLLKVVALTLAIFIALGLALQWFVSRALARYDSPLLAEFGGLAALVLTLFAGWVLFRIVALGVMQFFVEDVVRAVERRWYPGAAALMRPLPFARELGLSLKAGGRALAVNAAVLPIALLLLFTGIGAPVVLGLANAVLAGRELQDMVWQRHPDFGRDTPPIGPLRRLALGAVTVVLLTVPFLNLLAPVLGAASATHLVHRGVRIV